MQKRHPHWSSRLPFYYGWVIIGIAFVTMAVGVTARTAFSILIGTNLPIRNVRYMAASGGDADIEPTAPQGRV